MSKVIEFNSQREDYIYLLQSLELEGMDRLINKLDDMGFFKAPASTQYHLSYEGGLLEHSLNVYVKARELRDIWIRGNFNLEKEVPVRSIILCSLLHDIGKANDYTQNILASGKISNTKPYKSISTPYKIAHEDESVFIANKYIDLSEKEIHAIYLHNGMYGEHKYSFQGNETPLALILHFADMWASRILERGL